MSDMTQEQIDQLNAEMAEQIIQEIGEVLTKLGLDVRDVPPTFYPEAVHDIAGTYWREGLKAAADYMLARKVTASEFYAAEILKLECK